jgi:hypothetical protein
MATGDFGLRPVRTKSGRKYTGGGMSRYPVANGYATALFKGDPVKVSGGTIVLAGNGDKPIGVFQGASYIDANGSNVISEMLPASTSVSAGAKVIDAVNGRTVPVAYVADDPALVMVIRADSSLSVADFGKNARVSAGSGNTATKLSGHNVVVASFTTSGVDATSADKQTMVRVIGLYDTPGNSVGAANPLLEVIWISHADNFTNA